MLPGYWLIDRSVPLEHEAVSKALPAQIHRIRATGESLQQMERCISLHADALVYSNELGWAIEEVQTSTQPGTHVDAPYNDL